ncbi:MAG TPA: tRNA (5-methylaminomethyl-2-thiouridine)(34)-methyltransferase MnmD, partial [Ideonella sp.]|nr:tRNA (5-methylaminomethyl-2-thiouridine)(34)-methyltransferase MnmD [Ideonella sp.]
MKTTPVQPAVLDFDVAGVPRSPHYGDVYHPQAGALGQARHVFLGGNGLPERWRGRADFVVLECGFGLGHNFLATREAWRSDPARCERLHYVAVEQHPLTRADLARVHAGSPLAPLADELIEQWPPLTPNLHLLRFAHGRLRLLLALADARAVLPELVARVDAFYLDGFAPATNPGMWEPRVFEALARLAAPGATAATWSVARAVRDGLARAGFAVEKAAGFGAKREMTVARFAPRFIARLPPGRVPAARPSHCLVVGGGLAGCAAAWALTEVGVASTVVDRRPAPAVETSGNAAGVFHGVVTAHDGTHARFGRAAALQATPLGEAMRRARGVRAGSAGLLRLAGAGADRAALQAVLDTLGLPADYVRAVDCGEAGALAGVPLASAALF